MILANEKSILVVGYPESSMAQIYLKEISRQRSCDVITPEELFASDNLCQHQFIVSSWSDHESRIKVIDWLEKNKADLVTVIHDTVVLETDPVDIRAGTFILPFCTIGMNSKIGRHCLIGYYCLVGHDVEIGCGTVLRPGSMIIGKSKVGNHCWIDAKSLIANKSNICDRVELLGGSAFFKSIDEPGRYVGTPARKISDS